MLIRAPLTLQTWVAVLCALVAPMVNAQGAGRALPIATENYVIRLFQEINPRIVRHGCVFKNFFIAVRKDSARSKIALNRHEFFATAHPHRSGLYVDCGSLWQMANS